ncbi:MAG: hypothetical protein QNJ91_11590 [Gammaproteobacteria bacterium]|nr:hypothetical protein [Gammaproteobacteria bacterium]
MIDIRSLIAALAAIVALAGANAQAAVIDFDSTPPGTAVTSIAGVAFSSNTGLDLVVSNVFDAASGDNYLGVDDGGSEVFLPSFGDVITLDFATAITGLSVSFISTPAAPAGTFSITTLFGSVSSLATPDAILLDGGEVYVVTLTSATPFLSADLSGGDDFNLVHSFNIDDIAFVSVAEPPSHLTLGLGAMLVLLVRGLSPRIIEHV